MKTFVLLFQCKDKKGIVARLSDFIFRQGGNIVDADQHSTDPSGGHFFIRLEFLVEDKHCDKNFLESGLVTIAGEFNAEYRIYDKDDILRMGIFVSRPDHCLFDLIYLWRSGELRVDIPFVISNYERHREFVQQYKIPFYFVPATREERKESELLAHAASSDFLVLARYMFLLSGDFLASYGKDIINIHHGFLPSFKGANPYKQALEKGVKVIGATAHFVTEKLDEGPIIAQAVEYVSHEDRLENLVRKGKNLEKRALASAVVSYVDYRIIKYKDKTIVF